MLSLTLGSSRRISSCISRACLRSCSMLGSLGRGTGDEETVDIATSSLVPEVHVRQAERRRSARPFALLTSGGLSPSRGPVAPACNRCMAYAARRAAPPSLCPRPRPPHPLRRGALRRPKLEPAVGNTCSDQPLRGEFRDADDDGGAVPRVARRRPALLHRRRAASTTRVEHPLLKAAVDSVAGDVRPVLRPGSRRRSIRCTRPAFARGHGQAASRRSARATSPRAPPRRAWRSSRSRPRSASCDRSTATASTSSSSGARQNDVRCSEAITDAKGHRRKRPSQQDDPDVYVRVVDRQRDGIVISGAKLHITGAPLVHEQVVLPTKSMKPGEEDYAVACSVPTQRRGAHDRQHDQRAPRRRPAPLPDQPPHEHARGPARSSTTCSCRTSGCSSTARRRTPRRSPMRSGCGSARTRWRTAAAAPIASSGSPRCSRR